MCKQVLFGYIPATQRFVCLFFYRNFSFYFLFFFIHANKQISYALEAPVYDCEPITSHIRSLN